MNTTEKKPKRALTPTEREKFEELILRDKQEKTETETTYPGVQIAGKPDDDQIRRIKRVMKESEPDSLNQYERAEKEKRVKELEEILPKRMLPKKYVYLRSSQNGTHNYDFVKAAQFMAKEEMSVDHVNNCNEYMSLQRELGREELANVEHLRPES